MFEKYINLLSIIININNINTLYIYTLFYNISYYLTFLLQVELEKLNKASEEINRLELELDVNLYLAMLESLSRLKLC